VQKTTFCTASADAHASRRSAKRKRFKESPVQEPCTCCCRFFQDFSPIPRGGTFFIRSSASECMGFAAKQRYASRSRPTLLQHNKPICSETCTYSQKDARLQRLSQALPSEGNPSSSNRHRYRHMHVTNTTASLLDQPKPRENSFLCAVPSTLHI
jgi:hypothetical protein